jgi:O-antigen/teichoic acid export membrane protein
VYGGSFLNTTALFLANVLVARSLTIDAMGVFTIALLTLGAVSEMSDIGLNAALTRFIPVFTKELGQVKLRWLFQTVRRFRIGFSFAITILGVLLAPWIAQFLFLRPEVTSALQWSFLGVGGVVMLGFAITYFQASQRFLLSSVFNAVKGISRLLFVSVIFFFGNPTVPLFLAGFIFLPWVLALAAYACIPRSLRQEKTILPHEEKKHLQATLFRFSSFMTVWSVVAIIASRVDQIMISRLMTLGDVALYGVAMQCTIALSLFSQAITTVLAPRMNRFQTTSELVVSLRKTLRLLFPALLCLACVLYPTKWLLPLFFGEEYRSAMTIYLWLMYSVLGSMIGIPFSIILAYYHKTNIMAYGAIGQLIVTVLLNMWLIRVYGLVGAGVTFTLVMVCNQVFVIAWALHFLRTKPLPPSL